MFAELKKNLTDPAFYISVILVILIVHALNKLLRNYFPSLAFLEDYKKMKETTATQDSTC